MVRSRRLYESARLRLARNVRARRKEGRLSQEELADRAGLHRTYVGSIERGERNVWIDNIERLADALQLDVADLLIALMPPSEVRATDGFVVALRI
jgi:transcriptional regulator with XRE-family HTH domain